MRMVLGKEKLNRKLDALAQNRGLCRGIAKACLIVEATAGENCPVNDGQLKGSITAIPPKETDANPVGIVGTNLKYAPYVELGTGLFAANGDGRKDGPWRYQDEEGNWHTTSGQHPQPFLGPALRENADKVKRCIAAEYRKEVSGNG